MYLCHLSLSVGCSQAVLGLMSLIDPLWYQGDFRPYFTVYDPDFKHYTQMHDHQRLPAVILGVTNPFFLKSFENCPNILLLGMPEKPSQELHAPSEPSSPHRLRSPRHKHSKR